MDPRSGQTIISGPPGLSWAPVSDNDGTSEGDDDADYDSTDGSSVGASGSPIPGGEEWEEEVEAYIQTQDLDDPEYAPQCTL